MKYVGNLLDWGDHLFSQFTSESVAEATLLYQTATRLLGERPATVGPCGESGPQPRDYATIAPSLNGVDQLLVEVENLEIGARTEGGTGGDWYTPTPSELLPGMLDRPALVAARRRHPLRPAPASPTLPPGRADWMKRAALGWAPALSATTTAGADRGGRGVELRGASGDVATTVGAVTSDGTAARGRRRAAQRYCGTVVQQLSPVFCVPPNRTMWAAWDRAEDRLFKIHHCMDITGQRRELALLAPELDPMALVANGPGALASDERGVIANGALPPYRFLYLIDRAKAAAGAVAGFGSALLSALERRDGEALARLRTVQQQNLTAATTRLREWEIDLAREGLGVAERQRDAAVVRRDQLDGLIEIGRTGWEMAETAALWGSIGLGKLGTAFALLAGKLRLVPDFGSAFAMKYGGSQKGAAVENLAVGYNTLAAIARTTARITQAEGSYQRRDQAWRHQRELARRDVGIQERQVIAARLRLKSAERGLVLHQQSLAQQGELLAAIDGKVTNLELYAWYARELQRLHRDTFDHAMAMARLAEQSLRFERGDASDVTLSGTYWEPGRAGLLAGERLLLELQALERHFLETNHRQLEVDQAFSLAQIAPEALVALRATGSCEVSVPELFFDLTYPGQYRRRIRAVRLTIPCVTGPFVNVGATLELLGSHLRPTPAVAGELVPMPPQRTTTIATSTAQNDAGVFELSFRDERYMPFEGAGAVSQWRLRLPATFRAFDYATINDVVLSISYTALHDEVLRARVETDAAELEGSLRQVLATQAQPRVLSLRQDASATFGRLMRAPVGTPVTLALGERNLPPAFWGRVVVIERARLAIRTSAAAAPAGLALRVDGAPCGAWAQEAALGGLWACALPAAFGEPHALRDHLIEVEAAGELAPRDPSLGAIDGEQVADLMLVFDLRLG